MKKKLKIKIKERIKKYSWCIHFARLCMWILALSLFFFFNAQDIRDGINDYKAGGENVEKLSTKIFFKIVKNLEDNTDATREIWKYLKEEGKRVAL